MREAAKTFQPGGTLYETYGQQLIERSLRTINTPDIDDQRCCVIRECVIKA